jgi:alpha-glucuronidase
MKPIVCTLIVFFTIAHLHAENGHDLWLRTRTARPVNVVYTGSSPTLFLARQELQRVWQGEAGSAIALSLSKDKAIKYDGFRISEGKIEARTETGILYGAYEMVRRQQTGQPIGNEVCNPSYERRILDHWDNPDGSIERGYAGRSIFWRKEDPFTVTDRDRMLWQEYARADASIGINGSVLNNVNASILMLSADYLARAKAIADVLRPYGVRTYLSVRFSSPVQIGGLKTADPSDAGVIKWWSKKITEIYQLIPDFGGFLVKANSEGQPGPQDYGRTHADGANMLADIIRPYGGIIMWRAFVYNASSKDRATQAYTEFTPLDGKFRDNVIVQVKNGPVDFQPREPFSPLFGAMKKTSVAPEFQITQEYLGQAVHLVFLAPTWEECLKSDTYVYGPGSTVGRCTDGRLFSQQHTVIAGVSNIGLDSNWCGHPFAQANWYAFGRIAWNNRLSSTQIADEWLRLTFYPVADTPAFSVADWVVNFLDPVKAVMLESREAAVNYMMPLGLHHLFSANEHYGPGPWWAPKRVRQDWTPPYYHKADTAGIGFDRTESGSNAVAQYQQPLLSLFNNLNTCPDIYLLWFHHLPWTYMMRSGRTLWEELCYHYDEGVQEVRRFQTIWDKAQFYVDAQRFALVQDKLRSQLRNAQLWKDACLLYFQQFSRRPIPADIERPIHSLDEIIRDDMPHRPFNPPAEEPAKARPAQTYTGGGTSFRNPASSWPVHADNGDGTFTNPVIMADFPDLDVIRVKDTYYMLATTMFTFPGVPLLQSHDLVNWTYCVNIVKHMDGSPCYDLNGCNRYAHGQWAGSLRYDNGRFYVLFNTLNEGAYLCTSVDPAGPWTIRRLGRGFHDCGLLFDEDGKIYVASGYNKLYITELDSNFVPVSRDSLVFTGDLRPGLEGTHVYHMNGYYYLYCTYGGAAGFQVALRSKNIWGPYEEKVVLKETNHSNVNFGIHQGALIQTQKGEWWTMLFIDMGPFGRFPSLQPVTWRDNWPLAGVADSAVVNYRKPDVGGVYPVEDLPTSDEFSADTLGMQWSWNHNPEPAKWSLTERPGFLRLATVAPVDSFLAARNTLTQRIVGKYDQWVPTVGTTRIEVGHMKTGDVAGLCVFQDPCAYIAVKQTAAGRYLVMVNSGVAIDSVPLEQSGVYLRAKASNTTRKAVFEYSVDNRVFRQLGNELSMRFSLKIFTGNKFCLFNYATKEIGGYVDFDWFHMN